MLLSEVIKVWDILHTKNVGDLCYCDLEKALESVVEIRNNITCIQPVAGTPVVKES